MIGSVASLRNGVFRRTAAIAFALLLSAPDAFAGCRDINPNARTGDEIASNPSQPEDDIFTDGFLAKYGRACIVATKGGTRGQAGRDADDYHCYNTPGTKALEFIPDSGSNYNVCVFVPTSDSAEDENDTAGTGSDNSRDSSAGNVYPPSRRSPSYSSPSAPPQQRDEALLAHGSTPPFYSCNRHEDCQSGTVCVDNAGDRRFYCKPLCNDSQYCRGWPYPRLGCYAHRRFDGSLFQHNVCNDAPSYLR